MMGREREIFRFETKQTPLLLLHTGYLTAVSMQKEEKYESETERKLFFPQRIILLSKGLLV